MNQDLLHSFIDNQEYSGLIGIIEQCNQDPAYFNDLLLTFQSHKTAGKKFLGYFKKETLINHLNVVKSIDMHLAQYCGYRITKQEVQECIKNNINFNLKGTGYENDRETVLLIINSTEAKNFLCIDFDWLFSQEDMLYLACEYFPQIIASKLKDFILDNYSISHEEVLVHLFDFIKEVPQVAYEMFELWAYASHATIKNSYVFPALKEHIVSNLYWEALTHIPIHFITNEDIIQILVRLPKSDFNFGTVFVKNDKKYINYLCKHSEFNQFFHTKPHLVDYIAGNVDYLLGANPQQLNFCQEELFNLGPVYHHYLLSKELQNKPPSSKMKI